jgi:hypothetical protein
LALNHHAVTLALTAPANQLQLTAVPLTVTGDTLPADAHVHFTSSDSAVFVDSTGLLTAHSPKKGVLVIATLTVGGTQGLTLADTARVNVNRVTPVPVFTTLQVSTPGDSGWTSLNNGMILTTNMLDSAGNVIANTEVYVNVLAHQDILKLPSYSGAQLGHWQGSVQTPDVGKSRVVVNATVYGVSKSDTLDITVGYPMFYTTAFAQVNDTTDSLTVPVVTVSPGGIVEFDNMTTRAIDIIFDDSTVVQGVSLEQLPSQVTRCFFAQVCAKQGSPSGNIHGLEPYHKIYGSPADSGFTFRRFPTVGTYSFHSRPNMARGTVHVVQ